MDKGINVQKSIENTCKKLVGTYNLAVINKEEPECMYLAKNTGDISILHNKEERSFIVSSDPSILSEEFKAEEYLSIKDNEVIKIERASNTVEIYPF